MISAGAELSAEDFAQQWTRSCWRGKKDVPTSQPLQCFPDRSAGSDRCPAHLHRQRSNPVPEQSRPNLPRVVERRLRHSWEASSPDGSSGLYGQSSTDTMQCQASTLFRLGILNEIASSQTGVCVASGSTYNPEAISLSYGCERIQTWVVNVAFAAAIAHP